MKYLKDKNSRRRGVAIELAIMLLLVMAAVSTIITTTTMIQINKQKESFNEVDDLLGEIEKIEYDQIGTYFKDVVLNKEIVEESLYDTQNALTLSTSLQDYIQNELNTQYSEYLNDRNLRLEVIVNGVLTPKTEEIIKSDEADSTETNDTVSGTTIVTEKKPSQGIVIETTTIVTNSETRNELSLREDTMTDPKNPSATINVVIHDGIMTYVKTTEVKKVTTTTKVTKKTGDLVFTIQLNLYKVNNDSEDKAVFKIVLTKNAKIVEEIIDTKYTVTKSLEKVTTIYNIQTVNKKEDENELISKTEVQDGEPIVESSTPELTDQEKAQYTDKVQSNRLYSMNAGDVVISSWNYIN